MVHVFTVCIPHFVHRIILYPCYIAMFQKDAMVVITQMHVPHVFRNRLPQGASLFKDQHPANLPPFLTSYRSDRKRPAQTRTGFHFTDMNQTMFAIVL